MRFTVVKTSNYEKGELIPEAILELGDMPVVLKPSEFFNMEVLAHVENPIVNPFTDTQVDYQENWEGWIDALHSILKEEVKFIVYRGE